VVLLARAAAAQQPAPVPTPPRPPADTARRPVPGDTLRRPAGTDTVRTRRDSVTIGTPAAPRDSAGRARTDSVRGIPDSLATRKVVRDSIQPPIARAELPPQTGVGQPYRWTRDSLFTTGALTALDLLERVPGLTGFRAGWLASAQVASYLGDFRRVRVFRDGVELDAVDTRNNGVLDLPDVQLWQLEEVAIERVAGEVRLHLRTWTVRNTTPYTRVDIATGDEDTNLYRGFFGRRFGNGGLLQIGAQNFGTGARNRRTGGGGDAVSAFSRIGWARGRLSVDAYASRIDRQRNVTFAFNTQDSVLTRYEGRRDEGHVRVGYGDPDDGPWAQVIGHALRFSLEGTAATRFDTAKVGSPPRPALPLAIDSVALPDTLRRRLQFVVAGGFTRWGVRMSATDRVRRFGERTWHAPGARAAFERSWLTTSAYVEKSDVDSLTRVDLNARVQPLPWLALLGAVTRHTRDDTVSAGRELTVSHAEVGARLGRHWMTAGVLRRSATRLVAPSVYARPETLYPTLPLPLALVPLDPAATATTLSMRGPVYKDVRLELNGLAWDAAGIYRPQYQLRAELRLETNWLSRFKTGNFGLVLAITDEYRSETPWLAPIAGDTTSSTFTPAFNTLGALLEIRIQQATVSYQIRNALNREFEYVPGIRAPRPLSFYGVRWNFFN
jgi:hypothetical protein